MQGDRRPPEPGSDLVDPVIVTGAPRTGVRLLAAVLDGHPALASGPDLPVVTTLVQQWHEIRDNLAANHERNHGVSPEASRAAFRSATLKLFTPRLHLTQKRRFVLQTFAAAMLLDQFAAVFPEARFVLMIRDPRDVARSLLRCEWRDTRSGVPLPYTRDPVAAARFTLDFMNSTAQKAGALRASGRLMALHYERLCADPAGAMASLGVFLGEPPPKPRLSQGSAALVAESLDNPHPPLRAGALDSISFNGPQKRHAVRDFGQMEDALEQLRRALGYRP